MKISVLFQKIRTLSERHSTVCYVIGFILIIFFVLLFYSYKLTDVPRGVTNDEVSIGYNAILISETLRDETGRFLPFFALTSSGRDWKQPVSLYGNAILFQLLGPSVFSVRFLNVLVVLLSFVLIIWTNYLLLGRIGAFISGLLFLSIPAVLMHAHIGQENIMPVLFISGWLLGLLLFQKSNKMRYLFVSGFMLGVGIYSYKGMRAIVPPLLLITLLYLIWQAVTKKDFFITHLKPVLVFIIGISPFLVIMPYILRAYAGALFEPSTIGNPDVYQFFYFYLSNFDISALFISGDTLIIHSTGKHGVFLLTTLPLFVIGFFLAYKKSDYQHFWKLLIISFFLLPILFGQLEFLHRFSRLLAFIPLYVCFTTLGLISLLRIKKLQLFNGLLILIICFNFFDFRQFYFGEYADKSESAFTLNHEKYYQKFALFVEKDGYEPYMYHEDYKKQNDEVKFHEAALFEKRFKLWMGPGDITSPNAMIMSTLKDISGFRVLSKEDDYMYYHVPI